MENVNTIERITLKLSVSEFQATCSWGVKVKCVWFSCDRIDTLCCGGRGCNQTSSWPLPNKGHRRACASERQ